MPTGARMAGLADVGRQRLELRAKSNGSYLFSTGEGGKGRQGATSYCLGACSVWRCALSFQLLTNRAIRHRPCSSQSAAAFNMSQGVCSLFMKDRVRCSRSVPQENGPLFWGQAPIKAASHRASRWHSCPGLTPQVVGLMVMLLCWFAEIGGMPPAHAPGTATDAAAVMTTAAAAAPARGLAAVSVAAAAAHQPCALLLQQMLQS